jgi:hypothetical protein
LGGLPALAGESVAGRDKAIHTVRATARRPNADSLALGAAEPRADPRLGTADDGCPDAWCKTWSGGSPTRMLTDGCGQ